VAPDDGCLIKYRKLQLAYTEVCKRPAQRVLARDKSCMQAQPASGGDIAGRVVQKQNLIRLAIVIRNHLLERRAVGLQFARAVGQKQPVEAWFQDACDIFTAPVNVVRVRQQRAATPHCQPVEHPGYAPIKADGPAAESLRELFAVIRKAQFLDDLPGELIELSVAGLELPHGARMHPGLEKFRAMCCKSEVLAGIPQFEQYTAEIEKQDADMIFAVQLKSWFLYSGAKPPGC